MFAGLVTQALLDTGRLDPQHPERFRRPNRISVSSGLAERLRCLLEALEPVIYQLIEALALGAPLDADVLADLLGTDPAGLTDTLEAVRAHRPAHRVRRPDRVRPQPDAPADAGPPRTEHATPPRRDPARQRRTGAGGRPATGRRPRHRRACVRGPRRRGRRSPPHLTTARRRAVRRRR